MFRIAFLLLVSAHGALHLLGFLKAFDFATIKELTAPISRPYGLLWLSAAVLFVLTAVAYALGMRFWWAFAFLAALLSLLLVFLFWQDAKYGAVPNVLIMLAAVVGFGGWQFEKSFETDAQSGLKRTAAAREELLDEQDLRRLPPLVQQYLAGAGAVGKPKIRNLRVVFEGEMRGRGQDWFPFTAEQYSFFDRPERFFFMKAKVNGLPASGYHAYASGAASMTVKALSLFPVVSEKGERLNETETVTFFNDMCLMAPARLAEENIRWETLSDTSVKARYKAGGYEISAVLFFDEQGRLVDFRSEDRSDISEMKKYPFSTPLSQYQDFNGFKLFSYGEAVWHYPGEQFVYGKFKIKSIEYNVHDFR